MYEDHTEIMDITLVYFILYLHILVVFVSWFNFKL